MSIDDSRCFSVPGRVVLAAFSPNGRLFAIAGPQAGDAYHKRGFLQIYDAQSLNVVQTVPAPDYPLTCLAWSPDSTQIAFAGFAGVIALWDMARATIARTYYGHSPEMGSLPDACNPVRRKVLALVWPANDQIVSAGEDTCLCQWDPRTGETRSRSIYRHLPEKLSFSSSGVCLAVFTPPLPDPGWSDLDEEDGQAEVCDSDQDVRGKVSLFDLPGAQTTAILPATGLCFCAVWAAGTGALALGARDEIQIWDLRAPEKPRLDLVAPRRLFLDSLWPAPASQSLAWSPEGSRLAYCAELDRATARQFRLSCSDAFFTRVVVEIVDVRLALAASSALALMFK